MYDIDGCRNISYVRFISKGRLSMTNGDNLRQMAEQRGIPLRTLEDVKADLEAAKANDADMALARLMLRHGRLTEEARAWVAKEYQ
jgi:hypothetical protein